MASVLTIIINIAHSTSFFICDVSIEYLGDYGHPQLPILPYGLRASTTSCIMPEYTLNLVFTLHRYRKSVGGMIWDYSRPPNAEVCDLIRASSIAKRGWGRERCIDGYINKRSRHDWADNINTYQTKTLEAVSNSLRPDEILN